MRASQNDDRNRWRSLLSSKSSGRPSRRNDDIDTPAYKLGRQYRQAIVDAFRPDIVYSDVATFRVAGLGETAVKGGEERRPHRGG